MAEETKKEFRNCLIYSIFVRNYSEEGTFEAVRRDLQRIRALGTDIIWLLPIHPIGVAKRKGTLGSSYAIRDYRNFIFPHTQLPLSFCILAMTSM